MGCSDAGQQYNTVQYGAVRYGTVRYGTVRYGTVQLISPEGEDEGTHPDCTHDRQADTDARGM